MKGVHLHPLHRCSPGLQGRESTATHAEHTAKPSRSRCQKPAPTGRFRAESKYKMSSEEDSPSLAWSLSALMSVSTYREREKPQQVGFQASCFYLIMPTLLKKTREMGN